MKIELLSMEMFQGIYREQFENGDYEIDYFEYLQQNQKLYDDFSDGLYGLLTSSLDNEDEIIEHILKYVDLEMLYVWAKTTYLEIDEEKPHDEHLNDYVLNEILMPNIEYIGNELMHNTAQISNFLLDEIFTYKQLLRSSPHSKIQPSETDKIIINGNIQLWGFIFNELINKGYVTAPKHNGKVSHAKFARQLLQHFEFTTYDHDKQPSENYLTKALKENKYSNNKLDLFKIPNVKIAND